MEDKVVLTLKKEFIETAKEYAKREGQSLSTMLENYIKFVTVDRKKIDPEQLSPRIRKL